MDPEGRGAGGLGVWIPLGGGGGVGSGTGSESLFGPRYRLDIGFLTLGPNPASASH